MACLVLIWRGDDDEEEDRIVDMTGGNWYGGTTVTVPCLVASTDGFVARRQDDPHLEATICNENSDEDRALNVFAMCDTGCSLGIVQQKLMEKAGIEIRPQTSLRVCTANNTYMNIVGQATFSISCAGNRPVTMRMLVSDKLGESLLIGMHGLKKLGLLEDNWPRITRKGERRMTMR